MKAERKRVKLSNLREDIPKKGLKQEDVLKNVPLSENGFVKVYKQCEKESTIKNLQYLVKQQLLAEVVELADTHALGACGGILRGGSSPLFGIDT